MSHIYEQTDPLEHLMARLRAGDGSVREELVSLLTERLRPITRAMLRNFPRLRRWEQTEDILQNATLRLLKALGEVTPTSLPELLGLATLQIRRELIDLSRRYYGPEGMGANHATNAGELGLAGSQHAVAEPVDETRDLSNGAAWGEFHRQAAALPGEEREVFDLIWYERKTQGEAALLLGVSVRTIKRRWISARVKLSRALDGKMPE